MEPRRGGPVSKLEDPKVVARILQEVRFGVPPSVAARSAGVPDRTYFRWQAQGRDPQARGRLAVLAREFHEQVREAEAHAISSAQLTHTRLALGQTIKREVRRVVMNEDGVNEEIIEREFYPPHPGALQWWLERRVPQFYGAVVAKDADTLDPEEGLPPDAATLDPAAAQGELASILDRIAARAGAPPSYPGGVPQAGGD